MVPRFAVTLTSITSELAGLCPGTATASPGRIYAAEGASGAGSLEERRDAPDFPDCGSLPAAMNPTWLHILNRVSHVSTGRMPGQLSSNISQAPASPVLRMTSPSLGSEPSGGLPLGETDDHDLQGARRARQTYGLRQECAADQDPRLDS
jgi:hypothetical protein